MENLKLYVWENVLADWTDGIMFALASSPEEAQALILKHTNFVPLGEFSKPYKVYDSPVGFALHGGG